MVFRSWYFETRHWPTRFFKAYQRKTCCIISWSSCKFNKETMPQQSIRSFLLNRNDNSFNCINEIRFTHTSRKKTELGWCHTRCHTWWSVWISNFEMINEIATLQFQRAIIPEDAVSLEIETFNCADASKSLICITIYARIRRKTGDYSCKLKSVSK